MITASCCHQLTKREGFGVPYTMKDFCIEDDSPAMRYGCCCFKCYKVYIEKDLLLLTQEAEDEWMEGGEFFKEWMEGDDEDREKNEN